MFYSKKHFSYFKNNLNSARRNNCLISQKYFSSIDHIQKKKYALIFENLQKNTKIIFPDYKTHINLYTEKGLTIKKMIEHNKKILDNEFLYSISFHENDGTEISDSCESEVLCRLSSFKINVNGGEKIYFCFNINYLGNCDLQERPIINEYRDWNQIDNLMRKHNLTIKEAIVFNEIKTTSKHKIPKENYYSFSFESMIVNLLKDKYSLLKEFVESQEDSRKIRISKQMNFFFYLALTQNVALNMATFIFFSWDVMEPIVTCLSYCNIVAGLFFWSMTSRDFQIDEMLKWLQSKNIIHKNLTKMSIEEYHELEQFYNKYKI